MGETHMNLANQVALVTGAGQGIGKASALALAAAGAHVVVADIAAPKAEETAEAILSQQRRAEAVTADVGDLRDIDRMVRQTLEKFGQIDILLRSEEHTSELQSRVDLVCRLLLEKKKKKI